MPVRPLHRLTALGRAAAQGLRRRLLAAPRPASAPLVAGTLADLGAEQAGAGGRERLPPPPTRPPAPQRHAAALHPGQPRALGAPGQPRPGRAVSPAHRAAGHAPALASPAVSLVLAPTVPGHRPRAPPATRARDGRPAHGAGGWQSPVGRGAHPGRAPAARRQRRQVDDPTLAARGPAAAPHGSDVGDLPAQSRPGHLGLRLPPGHRCALPPAPRLLRHRPRHAPRGPRRRAAPPDRRLGRPAAARGHPVRPAAPVPVSRQRPHVWAGVHRCRGGEGHHGAADSVSGTATERHLRALPRQRAARVPRPCARPGRGPVAARPP